MLMLVLLWVRTIHLEMLLYLLHNKEHLAAAASSRRFSLLRSDWAWAALLVQQLLHPLRLSTRQAREVMSRRLKKGLKMGAPSSLTTPMTVICRPLLISRGFMLLSA
jgi:pyoverdine/dityrosine biosynthesis protein Dit1